MKLTIYIKVIMLSMILISVFGAGLGYYVIRYQTITLKSELEERAAILINNLALNCEYPVLVGDREAISTLAKVVMAQKDTVALRIMDSSGNLLFEEDIFKEEAIKEFSEPIVTRTDEWGRGEETIFGLSEEKEKEIGKIILVISLSELNRKINAVRKTITVSFIIAIVSVMLFFHLLLKRILDRPVKHLIQATERISKGDIGCKVTVEKHDEIGILAAAFNRMTENLLKITVSKDYVENIIKSIKDSLVVTNQEGIIKAVNHSTLDLLDYKEEDIIGLPIGMIFEGKIFSQADLIKKGSINNIEQTLTAKDGREIPVLLSSSLMRDVDGKVQGMVSVATDISQRKLMEVALRESQRKYKDLVNSINSIVWEADPKTFQFSFVSQQAENLLGYPVNRWIYEPTFWKDHIHEDDRNWAVDFCARATTEKRDHQFEYRMITVDGRTVWFQDIVNVIVENGEPIKLRGLMIDCTDRKLAEEKLQLAYRDLETTQKANLNIMADLKRHQNVLSASLKEKEVLLSEIHHRVKNNMQVVSSLMRLQSRYINDNKFTHIFKESENRIKSMALVHERLYKTETLDRINFREYINDLARDIHRSFGAMASSVIITMDLEDIYMNIETAVPCGLLINELISNSLKHAFPKGKQGEVKIGLKRNCDLKIQNGDLKSPQPPHLFVIELIVCDNGIGFRKDLDLQHPQTLGLHLVNTLIRQIRGEIEFNREGGTEWRIKFKEKIPRPLSH